MCLKVRGTQEAGTQSGGF